MSVFRSALLMALSATLAIACDSSTVPAPAVVACDASEPLTHGDAFAAADVGLYFEKGGDALLDPVASDVSRYLGTLWSGSFASHDSPPTSQDKLTLWFSTSADARQQAGFTASDGYEIVRQDPPSGARILVVANDAKNLQFGAYALLETLGVRFFHPKEEIVPVLEHPWVPYSLSITRSPAFAKRGLQLHTLHPIEYFHVFNEPSAEHLADAKRFVDWLVKTGQNYFQWVELDTVDLPTWQPYAQSIVDYAHSRGVRVGANVQVWGGAALQNNYVLVKDPNDWQPQMDAQIDTLMNVSWDVIELALGEFISSGPQAVIDWLNHAVEHVADKFPGVDVDVQNHVGNYPNLYVQYQGQPVYYYHLPQFADPRLGQTVHTLSLFDLYRDWGTYKEPDFHFQHDYILKELPSRRVSYQPESAYWISADIDVPLFLPEFIYARWNDIHTLTAEVASLGLPPLEGHFNFSSGHEWGYWLTDYLTAKMMWEPEKPLSYFLEQYTSAFGSCGNDIETALSSFIDLQTHYLFDERLLPYLQGENATVDEGYLLGYETHPKRASFEDVLAMSSADRAIFERNFVSELDALADATEKLETGVAARCRGLSGESASFCDELADGMLSVLFRARHASALYRAVLARAAGGDPGPHMSDAQKNTEYARSLIARREAHYRFSVEDLTGKYPNATAYEFGYLRPAHTLCYYVRREQQVQTLLDTGYPDSIANLPSCVD